MGSLQRAVVADLSERRHRRGEGEVGAQEVVVDHRQHDSGRAELQKRRYLRQVGVADDHVQAPVLLSVGMGLVSGVHYRALQRRLEADLLLEEVGPLAELKRHVLAREANRFCSDLASTRE